MVRGTPSHVVEDKKWRWWVDVTVAKYLIVATSERKDLHGGTVLMVGGQRGWCGSVFMVGPCGLFIAQPAREQREADRSGGRLTCKCLLPDHISQPGGTL